MILSKKSVAVVGLLDNPGGHYLPYARRFLYVLRKTRLIRFWGFFTSDSFRLEDFDGIVESHQFFNTFPALEEPAKSRFKLWGRVKYSYAVLARLLQVNRVIQESHNKPDLVIFLAVDLLSLGVVSFCIPWFLPYKFVLVLHHVSVLERTGTSPLKKRVASFLLRQLVNASYRIIVLDQFIKDKMTDLLPIPRDKIAVVIDPRFESHSMPVNVNPKVPKRFLVIGGLTWAKGVDLAIRAFNLVIKGRNDISLQLAGLVTPSSYKRELEVLLNETRAGFIHLDDRMLTTREYEQYIQESDCVILPYRNVVGTRSSGVLFDVIKMRKPMILSDVEGFASLHSRYGIGVLTKQGSIEDLAVKIQNMIEARPEDLVAMVARYEHLLEDYGLDKAREQMLTAFQE